MSNGNVEGKSINDQQLKECLGRELQLLSVTKDKISKIAALREVIGFFDETLKEIVEERLHVLSEKKMSDFASWNIIDALDEESLKELLGYYVEEKKMVEIDVLKEELNRIEEEMLETRRIFDSLFSASS